MLILAGDHLYRMDYDKMVDFHLKHGSEITVAVQPVLAGDAARFGLLKRDAQERITAFVEKPRDPDVLAQFVSRDDPQRPYLGSMGIYLFDMHALVDLLETTTSDDFGGQVIPSSLGARAVYGYDFDGYWEDIGTIRSFYETNLSLTQPDPAFNFYDPVRPIYTRPRYLPGSVINGGQLSNVLLAEGCEIGKGVIEDLIVGLRSQIASGVCIEHSILMGADYYDNPLELQAHRHPAGHRCKLPDRRRHYRQECAHGRRGGDQILPARHRPGANQLGGAGWHRGGAQEHHPVPRHLYRA